MLLIPIGMAIGIITARFLSPSDRGLLTLLLALPQTINILCNLGLDSASIYFHKKEKVPFAEVFTICILFGTAIGCVAAAALWVFRTQVVASVLKDVSTAQYIVAIATITPVLLFQYLGSLARASGRFADSNLRAVFEKLFFLLAVVVLLIVFGGGVLACTLSYLVIEFGIVVWLALELRPDAGGRWKPEWRLTVRMLRFGSKSYAQAVALHMHYKLDLYLVAAFLSNADVAFYSIAMGLAERSLMVPDALKTTLYPHLAAKSGHDAALLTARACRNTILIGAATALPLWLFGRYLLLVLYGSAYTVAAGPMYVLLVGVIFIGVTRLLVGYFTSINAHHHNVVIVLGSAVVNLCLNVLLIPRYGIMGAAVSSLITYSAQGLWALWLFRRLTGVGPRQMLLVRRDDLVYLQGSSRKFSKAVLTRLRRGSATT